MYDKLKITENDLRVLGIFTSGFDKSYYVREVQRILKISPRTSQLSLENLERRGVLISKNRGKIKEYNLSKNELLKDYLIFAEQYQKLCFLEENKFLREITLRLTNYINGIGIIFGSRASRTAEKDSDLDLFVVGNYNKTAVENLEKKFGIEINIKCYNQENFKKGFKDILIKEVLENHIVLLGVEEFVNEVFEWIK